MVFAARMKLKDLNSETKKIFINEHLTALNAQIFANARKLKKENKISNVWTYNCSVFIKKLGSSKEKGVKVESFSELSKVI